MSKINLYNIDCMEFMKDKPDNYYDLAIVDPPYRDQNEPTKEMRNASKKTNSKRFVKTEILGSKPEKYYFDELFRVSKNQIIWGINNFCVSNYMGFVVWVKTNIPEKFTMSMAEIAYLSKGLATISKCYYETSNRGGVSIHPTQKPVKLYKWLLTNYGNENDKILDTHGGSMSIALACNDLHFDLDLCELDKDYFEAGKERLKTHQEQIRMF